MTKIKLFTIGFTKTNAENFFTELKDAGVKRVVDVRLNNSSQLAGFAKQADLVYFLRKLCVARLKGEWPLSHSGQQREYASGLDSSVNDTA